MPKRWVIALLAAAVLLPAARAQMGGGVNPPALTAVGTGFPVSGGVRLSGAQPGFVPHRAIFLGTPFLFPDYASEPVVVQAPPPQIVVVQQPAVPEISDAVKPGPLMIEWRENRYVRVTGGENRSILVQPDYAGAPAHPAAASTPRQELPAAILVFRDGTRQEVQEYVIANGVMYIHGGYGQDGYRTKQIQLSSLDVPATLEANQQRGAKFILPASPNEVVTRP
jgi:hypothetical protein